MSGAASGVMIAIAIAIAIAAAIVAAALPAVVAGSGGGVPWRGPRLRMRTCVGETAGAGSS